MTRVEDFSRKIVFDGATSLLYSPEIKPEAKETLGQISEFLAENPEYSFVIYFNHISFNDPAIVFHVANKIDPKYTRHLLALVSYSHTDPHDAKHKIFHYMAKGLEKCGVETIRVIQTYQINNPEYGYTAEQAGVTYRKLMRRLNELRKANTPTGVIISPEGHRSESGELMRGESGVVAVGRLLAPIIYVPLAISYEGKYGRDSVNFGKKMRINIGEVVVQEDPKNYPSIDDLMRKLAMALPEEMRGVWR